MATSNLSLYDMSTVPNANSFRFGIVVSEWNADITKNLCEGAVQTLLKHGAKEENITISQVPGSFELIYGAKKMLKENRFDAIIAIGNVIQGETKHFDYVCEALDIEYRVMSNRTTYKSAELLVAFGGPNIYIDTNTNTVKGYWWNDKAEAHVDASELDDACKELFGC